MPLGHNDKAAVLGAVIAYLLQERNIDLKRLVIYGAADPPSTSEPLIHRRVGSDQPKEEKGAFELKIDFADFEAFVLNLPGQKEQNRLSAKILEVIVQETAIASGPQAATGPEPLRKDF